MPENGQDFLAALALKKAPLIDEIEVSVFGMGFGECLVISCGNNEFVVVDSFINKKSGNPIAIDYLNAMGFDATVIKQVILTHWHKDHIEGIIDIIQKASPEAKLVLSPMSSHIKFLEYMAIGIIERNESTSEYAKIIDFVKSNIGRVILPVPNRLIYPYCANSVEIYTLSPSDIDLIEYVNAIILPDEHRKTAYSFPESNELCIAMLIKFGTDGVLLGSDLENFTSTSAGWNGLVGNYHHTNNKPTLIKIPHHGSVGAHYDGLWTNILSEKPLSVLSVFNRGKKLPSDNDIDRIRALSRSLFIIGEQTSRNKEIEKKARKHKSNVKITSVPQRVGLARFRRYIDSLEWRIEEYGAAYHITNQGITSDYKC